MSWMTLSDIEIAHMESAIREMDAGSDRSSALVAAAFVEQNLEIALQCRLKRDDAINKEMFRVSGPLGTFSGKIHMGFMIGLYEKAAWSELDLIRKIRNEFAHKLDCVDFASSDRVTSWANRLSLADIINISSSIDGTMVTIGQASPQQGANRWILPPMTNPTPRQRYTRACKLFIVSLSLAPHFDHPNYSAMF
jgi:hypothetical protein